jgi:hypothetical protein
LAKMQNIPSTTFASNNQDAASAPASPQTEPPPGVL